MLSHGPSLVGATLGVRVEEVNKCPRAWPGTPVPGARPSARGQVLLVLAVELQERGVRPRAVDGGRAAVHQEGDADRLGGFPRVRALLDRSVGVGGYAAVAFLADRDGQGDELLGPASSAPGASAES